MGKRDDLVKVRIDNREYEVSGIVKTEILAMTNGWEGVDAPAAVPAGEELFEARKGLIANGLEVERLENELKACSKQLEEQVDATKAMVETNQILNDENAALVVKGAESDAEAVVADDEPIATDGGSLEMVVDGPTTLTVTDEAVTGPETHLNSPGTTGGPPIQLDSQGMPMKTNNDRS